MLAATACVTPTIYATKTGCTDLIPAEWRAGVEDATAPARADNDTDRIKAWINFGVAQTGQLHKANGRTADTIGIIERCEARDRVAVERAKPKLFGVF